MTDPRITALAAAVEREPDNHALRLLLAEMLAETDAAAVAAQHYGRLLQSGALPGEAAVRAGHVALATGQIELALACLNTARQAGVVDGVAQLQAEVDAYYSSRGYLKLRLADYVDGLPPPDLPVDAEREPTTTFEQVGGMDAVKRVIHRMIILPFDRPDIYAAYGRRSGGGVLLYGPPGCGKTLLARATAGECGLPFHNIRIESVLDPYYGVSERNLHAAFEQARAAAPCVLFVDELDALAYNRHRLRGGTHRVLVDQFLQELDAIGADNRDVLILGATNAPWDIDDALLRPGRFDRRIFVPPPDAPARAQILRLHLAARPTDGIDLDRVAGGTALFSGADLRALVERAVDQAIELALASGQTMPVTMQQMDAARRELRPSTVDWLSRAANYVEFSNQDGRYDDLADYLRSPEGRARPR